MKVKFKIQRSERRSTRGGVKFETYMQAYTVEAEEGMTILEGLLDIVEYEDPSLGFRCSCRSAICGSCAMTVNGRAKLACNTSIASELEKFGEIVVEPMKNNKVIKDLIIDQEPFWRKMEKITPYLNAKEEKVTVTTGDTMAINNSQMCIMCGACNASCSSLEIDDKFIGPAALAKSWRFVGDVREAKSEKRLEKLSDEHGMWDCVRCFQCTEYCPKGVEPLKQIERLRGKAIEADIVENQGAHHVVSMTDSISRIGMVDEVAMTFKTLGVLRALGMIPFGLKMQMHGKAPMPHVLPRIENLEEIHKIYKIIEGKHNKPDV